MKFNEYINVILYRLKRHTLHIIFRNKYLIAIQVLWNYSIYRKFKADTRIFSFYVLSIARPRFYQPTFVDEIIHNYKNKFRVYIHEHIYKHLNNFLVGKGDFDLLVLLLWSGTRTEPSSVWWISRWADTTCSSKTRPLLPAAKRLQFAVARDERTNRVTSLPLLPIPFWPSLWLPPNPNFRPLDPFPDRPLPILIRFRRVRPFTVRTARVLFTISEKTHVGTKSKQNPGQDCRTTGGVVSNSDGSMRTVVAGSCGVRIGECHVVFSTGGYTVLSERRECHRRRLHQLHIVRSLSATKFKKK